MVEDCFTYLFHEGQILNPLMDLNNKASHCPIEFFGSLFCFV